MNFLQPAKLLSGFPFPRITLLFLASGTLTAETIFVSPDGTENGTSWDKATTLQNALALAKAGDKIWVERGTHYTPSDTDEPASESFQLKAGVAIYGGFENGSLQFSERDPVRNLTVLSGDIGLLGDHSDNAWHVVFADGSGLGATTILDGFVIIGGNARGDTFHAQGGGLHCRNGSSPTISNCFFRSNTALSSGGAVRIDASSPTLENCVFLGNESGEHGGAIHIGAKASPSIRNCTFHGNAAILSGGAVYNDDSSPSLVNSLIWKNAAAGVTDTENASMAHFDSATFSHCLVENLSAANLNSSGTGSKNNLEPTPPLFIAEVDPLIARSSIDGDLRLLPNSPALDAGENSASKSRTDLAGNARIHNSQIDLGAFEQQGFLYVRETQTGSMTGQSWSDAFEFLQDALSIAASGQMILVGAGNYAPSLQTTEGKPRSESFALVAGVALLGGYPADGEGDRDSAQNLTILTGDIGETPEDYLDNAYHVLIAEETDSLSLLDGFTITGGNADVAVVFDPQGSGGALSCGEGCVITVRHCLFIDNSARFDGGAIHNGRSSSPKLIHCSFQENWVEARGGAIYNRYSSSPSLENCSFQGNTARFDGGAIFNRDSSSPTFLNCSFQGNSSRFAGGAIYNRDSSSPIFLNCSFQGNLARLLGGAIHNHSASPSLVNCSFQGNSVGSESGSNGGAIFNKSSRREPASVPRLRNCIIWNNGVRGRTNTIASSIVNQGSAAPQYSHCLIQNLSTFPDGTTNFDGSDPANDPRFVAEVNPLLTPHLTGGDLRLLAGSPAIDLGDSSANSSTIDLAGNKRVQGPAIDLGAFEGGSESESN